MSKPSYCTERKAPIISKIIWVVAIMVFVFFSPKLFSNPTKAQAQQTVLTNVEANMVEAKIEEIAFVIPPGGNLISAIRELTSMIAVSSKFVLQMEQIFDPEKICVETGALLYPGDGISLSAIVHSGEFLVFEFGKDIVFYSKSGKSFLLCSLILEDQILEDQKENDDCELVTSFTGNHWDFMAHIEEKYQYSSHDEVYEVSLKSDQIVLVSKLNKQQEQKEKQQAKANKKNADFADVAHNRSTVSLKYESCGNTFKPDNFFIEKKLHICGEDDIDERRCRTLHRDRTLWSETNVHRAIHPEGFIAMNSKSAVYHWDKQGQGENEYG